MPVKYMGEYKSEKKLRSAEVIPYGGTPLKQGKLSNGTLGTLLMLIPVVPMALAAVYRLLDAGAFSEGGKMYIIAAVIALVISVGLEYLHELIHASFYPREAEVGIWKLDRSGRRFVYCETPISRTRFLLMSVTPMILLGILPYILWYIAAPHILPEASMMAAAVFIYMTAGCSGDLCNIFLTLQQVPRGAKMFTWGLMTYWFEDKRDV